MTFNVENEEKLRTTPKKKKKEKKAYTFGQRILVVG